MYLGEIGILQVKMWNLKTISKALSNTSASTNNTNASTNSTSMDVDKIFVCQWLSNKSRLGYKKPSSSWNSKNTKSNENCEIQKC
jgi:hypothetical protein